MEKTQEELGFLGWDDSLKPQRSEVQGMKIRYLLCAFLLINPQLSIQVDSVRVEVQIHA